MNADHEGEQLPAGGLAATAPRHPMERSTGALVEKFRASSPIKYAEVHRDVC